MADTDGKPTFHHMNHSQSQRILWLLEELEIPYNLVLHRRIESGPKRGRAPPELLETHPMGKSPQLVTAEGRVIAESSAIAAYLLKTYDTASKFQGTTTTSTTDKTSKPNDWIRDESLTSFSGSSLSSVQGMQLFLDILSKQVPFFLRPLVKLISAGVNSAFIDPEMQRMLSYLNGELEGQDYFMGQEPGRPDFMLSFPFDMAEQRGWIDWDKIGGGEFKALKAWRLRCQARPAWKRALEKGNGYDYNSLGL